VLTRAIIMALDLQRFLRWSYGPKPGRDVAVALFVKFGLLAILYLLFFGPAHRPPADAAATAQALVGASSLRESR